MRITRLIGATLGALVLPAALAAQTPKPKIAFGVLGAVNLATVTGSDVPNRSTLVGYSAGAFVRVPFDATWSLQTGAEYAVKGVKSTDNSGGTSVEMKVELKYIEIPVLLHAATSDNASYKIYGEAGPAFSFKQGCTATGAAQGITVSFSCNDIGTLKSYDIGAMFGAGVEIPMGAQALLLGARYNLGFIDISDQGSNKNRNLQFLAGLRF